MIEWITLDGTGPSIMKWLAWARKTASRMQDITPVKRVRMPDGTLVAIEIREDETFIHISGGAIGSYQFFGSGPYLYKTYRDPSYPSGIDRMLPLGYATLITLNGADLKMTALTASAESPPDPSVTSWPYDADPRNTDNYLRMTPAHQWDGLGVHQWYGPTDVSPRRDVPHLVTQWQQALPCSGMNRYGSGSASWFTKLDMGYDFGPTLFSANPLVGVNKSPHSDWYGRAAWRLVDNTQFGSRSFIIMVDVNSVFYCYPTDGYGSELLWVSWLGEKGNVPAELTQSQACPWPSWVTAETLGIAAISGGVSDSIHRGRLRPMWTFNHAGTRAACVIANRAVNWSDNYFNSEFYDDYGTLNTTYKEDLPGMVEVEFSISLTGINLNDFTFTVSLVQERYSGNLGIRAPVATGYAMRAIGDVPLDALLLLEYRHYTANPSLTAKADFVLSGDWSSDVDPPLYDLKRPVKATIAVVSWYDGASWIEARRWLAYYSCYLPLGDPRPFYPRIEEFSAHIGETGYANHFRYIANIISIDMDSLSFCLGASVSTLGDLRTDYDHFSTYGAEAACIVTIAFNTEKDRRAVGHAELKPVASEMLDLTASYPNLASLTEFFPSATLDYATYDPSAWETDPIIKATRYATLTVRDGDGHSWESLVQGASESMMPYSNISNTPMFSGASHIYSPQVYTFWDGLPNVRPGMRWAIGGTLQAGTLSFTNYPYGAIHHGSILFLTTTALNNITHRFSTHRSGSWALFAGPFAARNDLSVWWINGVLQPAPALSYEQTLVDKIEFATDSSTQKVTFSHIEAMNTAFKKELTPEDYYFNLRYESTVGAEFKPASNDSSVHDWHKVTRLATLGIIWSHQEFSANRWYNEFCMSGDFVTQSLHFAYDSFSTFPTPRMEGVFLPPRV